METTINGVGTGEIYAGTTDADPREASPGDFRDRLQVNTDAEDGGGEVHGLTAFKDIFGDGPGQIPSNATITKATLSFNVTNDGEEIQVHRLLGEFDEQQVTWDSLTLNGNTDPGLQGDGIEATPALRTFATPIGLSVVDVTEDLQVWSSGEVENFGWGFTPTGGTEGADWDSSEAADSAVRPRLAVEYVIVDQPPLDSDQADLTTTEFRAVPKHALQGQTDVRFEIANQGNADAGAFDIQIVWSDDATIGNGDDRVVRTMPIPGLSADTTLEVTVSLQLDRAELLSRAQRDAPTGRGGGFVSTELDTLAIVVDPTHAVEEFDEANNVGRGIGVGQDNIVYFPFDRDDSGEVTPADAIFVINRLGRTVMLGTYDALADLDGNGRVTPTDAINVIDRLGYKINDAVIDVPQPPEDVVELSMTVEELDATPGIVVGEQFDVQVNFRDIANDQAVFSGYAEINFDDGLVRVDEIIHDDDYPLELTGTIGDGVVNEAGASDGLAPPADTRVFTLRVTALAAGTASFTSDAPADAASEIVVFGSDDDQRDNTSYGTLDVTIT